MYTILLQDSLVPSWGGQELSGFFGRQELKAGCAKELEALLSACSADSVVQEVGTNTSSPQIIVVILVSYWYIFILLGQIEYNQMYT